eukprot:gene6143-12443_t
MKPLFYNVKFTPLPYLILFLCLNDLCYDCSQVEEHYKADLFHSSTNNTTCRIQMIYGVVLTTIPIRFSTVSSSISSWFTQCNPPAVILIFIPIKYKDHDQFPTLLPRDKNYSHVLALHLELEQLLSNYSGKIQIIEMNKDWGPATRLVGLFHYISTVRHPYIPIDNWIICDDDVSYIPYTISRYTQALQNMSQYPSNHHQVLTHFKSEHRMTVKLLDSSQSTSKRYRLSPVRHVQCVDTILLPYTFVQSQFLSNGPLSYSKFTKALLYYHTVCPQSYYQDDYIISFLLHLSGAIVTSLWNDQHQWQQQSVARHIEGVSTSHRQMHMHHMLHVREELTKMCVMETSLAMQRLLGVEYSNSISSSSISS